MGLLSRERATASTSSWGELVATLQSKAYKESLATGQYRSNTVGAGYARPYETLTRLTTPRNDSMQYNFILSETAHSLSSPHANQCVPNESPSAVLTVLEKNTQRRFTINPLEKFRLTEDQWLQTREFPVCVGLPVDLPQAIHQINLNSEIYNDNSQKTDH